MKTITVQLADHSYPIYIGENCISNHDIFKTHIRNQQVMIVTNTTLAPLYLNSVKDTIQTATQASQIDDIIIPDGEQYKTLATLNTLFDALLAKTHSRRTTLVALGGGVVGDLTGFAAACYQRGVEYLQIPTTLLAQVDAAIGGKTAVNHRLGKNMIGAFYQPQCVITDIALLNSLAERDFSSGIAEVIKYALISDAHFFDWLSQHMVQLLSKSPSALLYAIQRSCEIKASIVNQDEKEANLRAILNFGHTIGHAIESYYNYQQYLHGEAVAIGMIIAAHISVRMGLLSQDKVALIKQLCKMAALPTELPPECHWQTLKEFISRDKKKVDNGVRWILLKELGKAIASHEVSDDIIKMSIDDNSTW